jgi:replicative DNA helicase
METSPLHNHDLEKKVLGSILIEPEAANIAIPILKTPEVFDHQKHQLVYKSILNLHGKGVRPDIVAVTQDLSKNNSINLAGGAYEITALTNHATFTGNLDYHATLLYQYYCNRKGLSIVNSIHAKLMEPVPDTPAIINNAIKELTSLLDGADNGRSFSISQWVDRALMNQKSAMQAPGTKLIPFRSNTLTEALGGLKKQRLYILAARPAEGKTVVGYDIAEHCAIAGKPAVIYSQEMSGEELAERALSKHSGVDGMRISNYCINNYEYDAMAAKDYTTMPLYIDDTPGLTMTQLRSRMLKEKRDHNIELAIVDYLQLCEAEDEKQNRTQQISKVSRGLKKLAKELDIPIVALSQLNRKSEEKANRKPSLAELRDSGSIEQDADTVILLHRPENHDLETYTINGEQLPARNLLIMIVAKNRGGALGEIPFKWIGSNLTYEDYE